MASKRCTTEEQRWECEEAEVEDCIDTDECCEVRMVSNRVLKGRVRNPSRYHTQYDTPPEQRGQAGQTTQSASLKTSDREGLGSKLSRALDKARSMLGRKKPHDHTAWFGDTEKTHGTKAGFQYRRMPMGPDPQLWERGQGELLKKAQGLDLDKGEQAGVRSASDERANTVAWDSTVKPTDTPKSHVPRAAQPPKQGGTPVSEKLFDYLTARKASSEFKAKFEIAPAQRSQERPVVENATLAQIKSGKYQVNSVDPAVFDDPYVIPWVDLYCGAGGMGFGAVETQGGFTLVCALSIDNDNAACMTHRLSHPEVPVVQQSISTWTQVHETIEKYLPQRHWHKLWVHASNPCVKASTQNGTNRDLDQAEADMRWVVGCLNNIGPAVWTIENVPPLFARVRGLAPFCKVVKMQQHCHLCQPRKRLILSNSTLNLGLTADGSPTLHEVLGPHKGWHPTEELLQKDAWSDHKTTHAPSYVVTGGAQYAGAKRLGDFSVQHLLDWRDKAVIQSFTEPRQLTFPTGAGEQAKKRMVGNMVPPAFAKQLCLAACEEIQSNIVERQFDLRVMRMENDENVTVKKPMHAPITPRELTFEDAAETTNKGIHGQWINHPQLGWHQTQTLKRKNGSIDWEEVKDRLSIEPWLKVTSGLLPAKAETKAAWHARLHEHRRHAAVQWRERCAMNECDAERHRDTYIQQFQRKSAEHRRKVKNETNALLGQPDSNAELQKSNPDWYGPYLDEGEHYMVPRTEANLSKAYVEMEMDQIAPKYRHLLPRLKQLVYKFWILFDGKMRSVKGVTLDLDLSGVKPIRKQPYRWSPVKMQQGKALIDEFLEQGLIKPAVSEWGAPALLVPKPHTTPVALRLVVDFRELNKCIVPDTFEPPSCDLCMSWLAGKPVKTCLDMRWGFHQCKMSERMQQYFTFVTPIGTYNYTRLVMGFVNATAEFQRAMNHSIGDSLWKCAVAMVDDLMVASPDEESHMTDLEEVFAKLAARNHSVKPSKVRFMPEEIEYLGKVSTEEGIKITQRHKTAVAEMPYPIDEDGTVDVTRLRSGVGLFKFCRMHIPRCAWICAPLNELTAKEGGKWGPLQSLCWDALKYFVIHTKGLYHLDYTKPIFVCTDGSKRGVGGYIYQRHGNDERVCSYFSRQTTKDEQKWDTRELELLAVLATLEAHHHLLDGQRVILQTDHRNLTYLMNLKEPSGRLGRWVMRLSEHNFAIEYRKGKYMEISDCMSRNPQEKTSAAPSAAPEHVTPEYEMLLVEHSAQRNENTTKFNGVFEIAIQPIAREGTRPPKQGGSEREGNSREARDGRLDEDDQEDGRAARQLHERADTPQGTPRVPGDLWDELSTAAQAKVAQHAEHARSPEWSPAVREAAGNSDSDSDVDSDDEAEAPTLRAPKSQTPTLIKIADLKRAQQQWAQTRELREILEARDKGEPFDEARIKNYELYEDLVVRVTRAETEMADTLRPFVPPELQKTIMQNYHNSIWGAHRNEKATFREVASRYFWPAMYEDIREYVSKCDVCQLAKGGRPTRQGLLHGRHYSHAFTQMCMDLVGPVHQESRSQDKYLLVMVDPFTHFTWIELIDTKKADTVVDAFVRRILCEEGAPRAMLTDNGTEFKNKHLAELMSALEVDHQFAPAYHPQSNQAERVNRFVVETLRALVRSPGAMAKDWQKYVKYVEFALRRLPIPGTNITPFMAMRGRDPILAIDLPLAGRAPTSTASLPQHVQEIQKMKHTAEKLVKSASEETKRKNKDLPDLSHQHVTFPVGSLVRLWGVQRTTNGDAAKLKLRNGVYEVTAKNNDLYDLKHVVYPEIVRKNTHVSHIALWRGEAPASTREDGERAGQGARAPADTGTTVEKTAEADDTPQGKLWDMLRPNDLACFVFRDESPAHLRTAEVVNLKADKRSGEFWYWIDKSPGKYKPAKPIAERELVPEWADERGQTRVKPTAEQRAVWAPRQHSLSIEDIEIILPVMKTRVGGQVKPEHADKINDWLKRRAKHDRRAERALRAAAVEQELSALRALGRATQASAEVRELTTRSARRAIGGPTSTDSAEHEYIESRLLDMLSCEGLRRMGADPSAVPSREASSSRTYLPSATYESVEAKTRCRGRAAT